MKVPAPCRAMGGSKRGPSTPVPTAEGSHSFGTQGQRGKEGGAGGGGDDVSVPPVRSRFCRVVWEAFSDAEGQEL